MPTVENSKDRVIAVFDIDIDEMEDASLTLAFNKDDNDGRELSDIPKGSQFIFRLYGTPISILDESMILGVNIGSVSWGAVKTLNFADGSDDGEPEEVGFQDGSGSVSHTISALNSVEWYGTDLGTATVEGGVGNGSSLKVDNSSSNSYGTGRAKVSYKTKYKEVLWDSVAGDENPVRIFVVLED